MNLVASGEKGCPPAVKAPETPRRPLPPFLASVLGENLQVAGMGGDSGCESYKTK